MALPGETTTTTTLPCIYKAVTLQPGEQFTLPPGAQIIGSTDINSISSTCPLPDPSQLEELQCFIAKPVLYVNNEGGVGTWFEMATSGGDRQRIVGFTFNDVFYPITPTSNYNGGGASGILTKIQEQIPAVVNFTSTYWDDGSTYNWLYVWQIQTFPSVANNLFVNVTTDAENFNPSQNPYLIPFVPKALANTGGAPVPNLCPAT